jgi:ABC-type transport system substrate-binding protein
MNLWLNPSHPILNDVALRKALSYAIHREAIVKAALKDTVALIERQANRHHLPIFHAAVDTVIRLHASMEAYCSP